MGTLTQIDSIEENVPHDAQAVAGYTGGSWPTFHLFERDFPNLVKLGRVLSIAPQAYMVGRCLDVEPGDAGNSQAPGWYKLHADKSEGLPWLYTSAGNGQALIDLMSRAGYHRGKDYFYWSAHYAGRHICGPHTCGYPQADGTQYDDHFNGVNLDASEIQDYCYRKSQKPKKYPIGRFATWPEPVPHAWLNGHFPILGRTTHIKEREVVANYLRVKNQKNPNPHWLFAIEQQLLFLRKNVWYWAHKQHDHQGHPSWGVNWRGWRYMQLHNWTEHVHQIW